MSTSTTAWLGVLFTVLATVNTYLMFKLWGYPFDKQTRTSEAPPWAMLLHRALGYGYAVIGWVNSERYYEKAVGAISIPDSSPGIYQRLISQVGDRESG